MEPKRFNIIATGVSLFVCLVWITVSNAAPAIEEELITATNRITTEGEDLKWVQATVDGQNLTLAGYVPDTQSMQRAQVMAKKTNGINQITNNIKLVGTEGSCQEGLNDALSREKIQFQPSSSAISENSDFLLKMVAVVARNCASNIFIIGHTDGVGEREANQRLSERRAASVRSYLISSGVSPQQLGAMGFGDTRPIYDNNTPEGREKNRRIEFVVTDPQA